MNKKINIITAIFIFILNLSVFALNEDNTVTTLHDFGEVTEKEILIGRSDSQTSALHSTLVTYSTSPALLFCC